MVYFYLMGSCLLFVVFIVSILTTIHLYMYACSDFPVWLGEDHNILWWDAEICPHSFSFFFKLCFGLLQVVPHLLGSLVGGSMSPTQHLEQQQALVKQFAEILEFVLKFDEYKVSISRVSLWLYLYFRIIEKYKMY